jgi:hypothetical protein
MAGTKDRDRDQRARGNQQNDADQPEDLQRALEPEKRPDLQGDAEENRNLSGSTTWETLTGAEEKGREREESERRGRDEGQR